MAILPEIDRPPWQTSVWREALRALVTCGASVLLGGACGWVAGMAGASAGAPEAAVFTGAAVGLLLSYAMVFALERGPWFIGLAIIGVADVAVAWLAGSFSPSGIGPLMSLLIATAFHLAACIVYGYVGRARWPRVLRGVCKKCGYPRRGLAINAVCPECGAAAPSLPAQST